VCALRAALRSVDVAAAAIAASACSTAAATDSSVIASGADSSDVVLVGSFFLGSDSVGSDTKHEFTGRRYNEPPPAALEESGMIEFMRAVSIPASLLRPLRLMVFDPAAVRRATTRATQDSSRFTVR
jgi:hypothetical protein